MYVKLNIVLNWYCIKWRITIVIHVLGTWNEQIDCYIFNMLSLLMVPTVREKSWILKSADDKFKPSTSKNGGCSKNYFLCV